MRERLWVFWTVMLIGSGIWMLWIDFLGTLVETPSRNQEASREAVTRGTEADAAMCTELPVGVVPSPPVVNPSCPCRVSPNRN